MAYVRQTNFSAGELAPSLWGRTDLEKFAEGLRRCRNFFVSRAGEAISRPGTTYVTTQRDNGLVRLIPFVYSDTQSYCCVFTDGHIRFISYATEVQAYALDYESLAAYFTVGQIVTGFTSGATGIITSDDRVGTLGLQAVVGSFIHGEQITDPLGGNATVHGTQYSALLDIPSPYVAADLARLQFTQTGDIITITHPDYPPYELRRLAHNYWTITEVQFAAIQPYFKDVESPFTDTLEPYALDPTPVADLAHPAREWTYKVTVIAQDTASGAIFETLPATVTWQMPAANVSVPPSTPIPTNLCIYSDKALTLRRPTTGGLISQPAGWNTFKALAFNFYRGRGDLFGFIGQTKTRDFVDVGHEPDYSKQPPLGQNPFKVYDTGGTLVRTEKPISVAFFQERRVFAGTNERPGWLFFSQTGNYKGYDLRFIHMSGEALIFEVAARRREEIRSLLPLRRLLIFTSASVWSIGGQEGSPLDFDSVDVVMEEDIGATTVRPLVVEGAALYSRAKGTGVRALIYKPKADGAHYTGVDISIMAQHLFLGLTQYSVELGDSLPHSISDWCYQEDPFGIVWAMRADGLLLSLTFSPQQGMWAWARHDTDGKVVGICSVPEADEDAVYLVVERTVNGVGVHYVERMSSRVQHDTPYDDICVDCAITQVGAPTATITGLAKLEGKSVYALCYGNAPQGPYTVNGGQITLEEVPTSTFTEDGDPVAIVHVGLLFTPELETLDLANTDARLRQKTVKRVGIEVSQSKGLWVGQDFDHLKEWRQRTVADSYDSISAATELVTVNVSGKWDGAARAALRQTAPLPVTVLGLTREVDFGE